MENNALDALRGLDGGASPDQVGRYRYDVDSDRWEWDARVFEIHGYVPGEVEPTTRLLLAHRHPEDRDAAADQLAEALEDGKPFSSFHRIVGVDGQTRHVLVTGEGVHGEHGRVELLRGLFIDLTVALRNAEAAAVGAATEHRAVIEQAKGALMLAYGLGDDEAFAMLSWWSRNRNVKVRDLAARLVAAAADGEATDVGIRKTLDDMLDDATR